MDLCLLHADAPTVVVDQRRASWAAPSTEKIKPFKIGGRGVCMSPLPEISSTTAESPPMPWFGIDIGGSLVKVVYFEPTDDSKESKDHENLKTFVKGRAAYCNTGTRDVHLQMDNVIVNNRLGSLHFIRFPTSEMKVFLRLVKTKEIASVSSTVCATGGGAFKFEDDFQKELLFKIHKFDEMDSLIRGIQFVEKNYPRECYYWSHPVDDKRCRKVPFDFSSPYPFLVVNIGSGVSILAVYSENEYKRITGTRRYFPGPFSPYGCETFEEAISLAEVGDSTNVDKLVKDIYGGDYMKFNLRGNTVASRVFKELFSSETSFETTPYP
ncbi:Pantothenate kinase 1 like protein [Argiope bruennichi]|uniref:Pantothenate kinase 1 like protein n=1 Tax=Argiope bruennichi TaxID=94029 RepID=A0A8T0E828_ARGBR|nr:Pantothenate kinase 1 like protein [Argiope bruennichi]